MPRAIWNGAVLAETESFEEVEGNVYFPPKSIDCSHFKPASKTTKCGWKGTAHYYDITVGDALNPAAAWYYPEPQADAEHIRNHIAFWRGVTIER